MTSIRQKAMAVASKIGHQFPATPEGKLMHAVVKQAIADLFDVSDQSVFVRRKAADYLLGDIYSAEICGVDSSWIRGQLKKAGVDLENIRQFSIAVMTERLAG